MHRAFQSDLCRLRLTTARSYVKLLTDGQMGDTPVVGGTNLRIGAAVQGLGPFFKLKLDIQNGGAAPLTNLPVTVTFNQTLYKVPPNQSQKLLPMLLPGVLIKVEVDVECLDPNRPAEQIKVLVLNPASAVPFVSAIVQMPPSDVIDD